MNNQIHILNGDALKEQFPENLVGEIMITRACLVDGDLTGKTLVDFFNTRANFIGENYPGIKVEDYFEKSVPEFERMQSIQEGADVNLWFEDDLFCQVNLWFVLSLIGNSNKHNYYLIRPKSHNQYGFGGLEEAELLSIYNSRTEITELVKIKELWESYRKGDTNRMQELGEDLKASYPYIFDAIQAHIERIPSSGKLGRPTEALIAIMKELDTVDFGIIYREFNKRESIYGYGDLQVKRLYDQILHRG